MNLPLLYDHPASFNFFSNHPPPNPSTLTLFNIFGQYHPNEMRDKHKYKLTRESCFSMFRRLWSKVKYFSKQHFSEQYQKKIWFEIITTSGIKRSKTKIIITNERKRYYCYKIQTLPMKSSVNSSPFLQENLQSHFLWFFENLTPPPPSRNKGVFTLCNDNYLCDDLDTTKLHFL